MLVEVIDQRRRETGEIVVPVSRIGKCPGAQQHSRRGQHFALEVFGRDALAAAHANVQHHAATDVVVQPARRDINAVGDVVARRIGVRSNVHGRADLRQSQIRAGMHVGVHLVHEWRIARPDVNGVVNDRRDVDQHEKLMDVRRLCGGDHFSRLHD